MRILFPTLARFPSPRASIVQVANMAQAFAERGHQVRLVAPAGPDPNDDDAVDPAERFGFSPAFSVVTLSRRIHRGQSVLHAARIARMAGGRTDLVFSRNLRACLLPAMRGVPTVFEAHTLTSLQRPQDRWVLQRLHRAPGFRGIVAISQVLADDLVTELGVDADRILVAHDAVRLADMPAPEPLPPAAPGSIRVLYTGSMFRGRGVELLVALAEREHRVVLHLVGGPEEAAHRWAAEAPRARADGRLVVHGPVSPARARALQQGADVLVAPFARQVATDSGIDSSRWMSPMKVFEYLASGRPMIISDLPVLHEVIRPDVDALIVPPEDVDALAAAVRRLGDDPALAERLATAARARVEREFTWDLRVQRILARFVPEASGQH